MLRLRQATPDDLEQINELANLIEFEQGIHNWTLYYYTSPSTFYVYEKVDAAAATKKSVDAATTNDRRSNEVVGYVTRNLIDPVSCVLTHHIMVLPEYRNQRMAKDLLKGLDADFDGLIVANYNNKALKLVNGVGQKKPVVFGPKYTGYYGFLPARLPDHWRRVDDDGFSVVEITSASIDTVLAYDKSLHPVDRSRFMKEWLTPRDRDLSIAYCVTRQSDGHVCGYGAVRMMTDSYYDLAPVYAESPGVAEMILRRLACDLWAIKKDTVELYVSFPAEQKTTLKFCLELGLYWHYSEMRTYENVAEQPSLPWRKVYSAHEFWLI